MTREVRLVVIGIGVLLLAFVIFYIGAGGRLIAREPQQPIDFFHRIHAGVRQIPCQFCHRTVKTVEFAGIPETQFCLRCHRVIIPNFPEIKKLHAYWERGERVPWVRVNLLPGFVLFDHRAHTVVGRIGCVKCHGDVKSMDRLRQAAPLSMGWCLKCHRTTKVPIRNVNGTRTRGETEYPPTHCWTCHR